MSQESKKNIELFYVKILQDHIPDLPATDPLESRDPDFIWPGSGNTLGVRVARLAPELRRRRRLKQIDEAERRMIIQQARRLYEKKELPCVEIQVMFRHKIIEVSRRKELSALLADAVQRYLPEANNAAFIDNKLSKFKSLPKEFLYLSILRTDAQKRNDWNECDEGRLQEKFIDGLQRVIEGENIKVPEYLRKCSQCCLCIVADGTVPPSLFEPKMFTMLHHYHSLFHRTFFIEAFTKKVIELNTTTGGGASSQKHASGLPDPEKMDAS